MLPLVDVILPFYNRIEETCAALNSVLNQSYDNVHIILVNDSSSVDLSLLLDMINDQECCMLVSHPFNQGASAARNTGLLHCIGSYIAFLDSDDFWHPFKLSNQIAYMLSCDSLFSCTDYFRFSSSQSRYIYMPSRYFLPLVAFSCRIATPTVIIHCSLKERVFFDTTIALGEDIIVWCSLLRYCSLNILHEPLTFVRTSVASSYYSLSNQRVAYQNIAKSVFTGFPLMKFIYFLFYQILLCIRKCF